ncbi:unnamed protein product [Linum tenue]|uniref:Uncharacterized protein n=1 Tax=Linum tenue TaxID=586396 RepID=A0AAV0R4K3_9ROSI|nr:unnamed protein product [Linum tenue]
MLLRIVKMGSRERFCWGRVKGKSSTIVLGELFARDARMCSFPEVSTKKMSTSTTIRLCGVHGGRWRIIVGVLNVADRPFETVIALAPPVSRLLKLN